MKSVFYFCWKMTIFIYNYLKYLKKYYIPWHIFPLFSASDTNPLEHRQTCLPSVFLQSARASQSSRPHVHSSISAKKQQKCYVSFWHYFGVEGHPYFLDCMDNARLYLSSHHYFLWPLRGRYDEEKPTEHWTSVLKMLNISISRIATMLKYIGALPSAELYITWHDKAQKCTHNYSTRQVNDLELTCNKTLFSDQGIRTSGPILWNSLTTFLKESKSVKQFLNQFKRKLILNYELIWVNDYEWCFEIVLGLVLLILSYNFNVFHAFCCCWVFFLDFFC